MSKKYRFKYLRPCLAVMYRIDRNLDNTINSNFLDSPRTKLIYGRKTILIAASSLSAKSNPAFISASANSFVMSGLIFTLP